MPEIVFPPVQPYRNRYFLESEEGRSLRILAEYIEPYHRLSTFRVQDTLVFFGSSRILSPEDAELLQQEAQATGNEQVIRKAEVAIRMSKYYDEARLLSKKLTIWSKQLERAKSRFVICTGGGLGIMEAANRGASEERGLNMGLNSDTPNELSANPYVTRHLSFSFHYSFMRKFWFLNMAKACIFFPGGLGTLDELFEVLTLVQNKKIPSNIPIVLFGEEYWNTVLNFESLAHHGTISEDDLQIIYKTSNVDDAFDYISTQLENILIAEEESIEEMSNK